MTRQSPSNASNAARPKVSPTSLVVVGVGNIGGYTSDLAARVPGVRRLIVIDCDRFEEKNIAGQQVGRHEIGKAKARAVARRLRRLRPDMKIVEIVDDVRNVPLGYLRASVVLGCLDSRTVRRYLNQATWRLNTPYIDAGVAAGQRLARVNVYASHDSDAPCYECGFTSETYAQLEQKYPCAGEDRRGTPTNAPASLGALAASLQVLACEELLERGKSALDGRELLVNATNYERWDTKLPRNAGCRYDHRVWDIRRLPGSPLLGDVFALAPRAGSGEATLRVPGMAFARKLTCASCGARRPALRLFRAPGALPRHLRRCPACGGAITVIGFDLSDRIEEKELSPAQRKRPLRSLGLRDGDVIDVAGTGGRRYFELDSNDAGPQTDRSPL